MTHPVITIDGPSASGKGTLARLLAERLGFAHLDTGKIYRYVALTLLKEGGDPDDEAIAVQVAENLKDSIGEARLDDPALLTEEVGQATSKLSRFAGVRAALLEVQRHFAHHPPAGAKGAVLDGRDTGTVICPDAPVKFYVDASPEVRAERRYKELSDRREDTSYEEILTELKERDERDTKRAVVPLKSAPDAVMFDTTEMSIEEVLDKALTIIRKKL